MKASILFSSPRKDGNTSALLHPFCEELDCNHVLYDFFSLYDLNIEPCHACRNCQQDFNNFHCRFKDDVAQIFDSILGSDLIVLATPIYSWYCTAPMKALLDRLVYGMNKFYGETPGPSLWEGKTLAVITTCGYPPDKGADLFEAGMKRYCKHSHLHYAGMLCERHLGYNTSFMDEIKVQHAQQFAKSLIT